VDSEIIDCQLELAQLYLDDKGYRLGEHLQLYSGAEKYDAPRSLDFLEKLNVILQGIDTKLTGPFIP
jgi:hypothetical protein